MGAEALHDLTAAYALDALDSNERRVYEAHLAHCERCRGELASFSETTTMLAYGAEAPPPPPRLRARILERAHGERPNVVPLRPRWTIPVAGTAAVATAAAVVLAVWTTSLSNKVGDLQSRGKAQERVAAVVAAPGTQGYTFGDHGKLVVAPDGEAALVFTRLGPARPGMTYEAWVAENGKPKPAGTFAAGAETTSVPLDEPVPVGATVMVTQERAGGTDKPTHRPILTAKT
jgi:anti-sigma-K factor RskA